MTFNFSNYIKNLLFNRLLVINELTCFYNSKNSYNSLVANLFQRYKKSFSVFSSLLYFLFMIKSKHNALLLVLLCILYF